MGTPKTRRKEEIKTFRRTVLDTALTLMKQEKDWNKVSINSIAKIMRYTPPNIYHYFKNKSDIEYSLLKRGLKYLNRILKETSNKPVAPQEVLIEIAHKYWNFAFENQQLYQIAFMQPQHYNDLNLVKDNIQIIIAIFKKLNPRLEKDKRAAYYAYQSFYYLIHGYVSIRIINKNVIPDVKYFESMIEILIQDFIKLVKNDQLFNINS